MTEIFSPVNSENLNDVMMQLMNRVLQQDRRLDKLETELMHYKADSADKLTTLVLRQEKFEQHFEDTFELLTTAVTGIDKKLEVFVISSNTLEKFKGKVFATAITIAIPLCSFIAYILHDYVKR